MQLKKLKFILILALSIVTFNCDKASNTTDDNESTEKETFKINVVHHISRDSSGNNPAINTATIERLMRELNANFNAFDIFFVTKNINFLDNTAWNNQFIKQDDFIDQKVLKPFEDNTSFNVFYFIELADRIDGEIDPTLSSTALFPDQGNNIKLSRIGFEDNNITTFTHEVGHYLGLYHTDETFQDNNGNVELVNGSNCENAGDFICDTPASPILDDTNISERPGTSCTYIGTETDPNGETYSPDIFNFMSTWDGSERFGLPCRRRFTEGQIAKVKDVLNNERAMLLN